MKLILLLLFPLAAFSQNVHMWAGSTTITDANNTTWTPNICQNTLLFNNPGTFPSPIYNQAAYSPNTQTAIVCNFPVTPGLYTVDVHLIEPVRSFNAPQKRVFSVYSNGGALATNIDIFQRAGGVEIPFDVVGLALAGTSGITITMPATVSSSIFSGIELQSFGIPLVGGIQVNGVPIGTATGLNIVSGNGVSCQVTLNNPTNGIATEQCNLAAPSSGPGYFYNDGSGHYLWAPSPSSQTGTQSGIIVTPVQATGAVGLAVNPTVVPFLGSQNTYTGAFNDFSGSLIVWPGANGVLSAGSAKSQPACTIEGTPWYTPGSLTTNGVFQVCQNQSGVLQWVTH